MAKKDFTNKAGGGGCKPGFNKIAECPMTACRSTFREELADICAQTRTRDLRARLEYHGWEYTGLGKGNHMQYRKDGFKEPILVGGRDHDAEPVKRYRHTEISEIYARALPRLFPELAEAADAKALGKPENYRMAAHMVPVAQREEALGVKPFVEAIFKGAKHDQGMRV